MKKITSDVIRSAQEAYLKYATVAPKQFNIKYSESNGWTAEFLDSKTNWTEGFTTWCSDTKIILDLFFSCDVDDLHQEIKNLWNTDWNDE